MGVQQLRIDQIKIDFETYAYRDELNDERVRQYQQDIDDLPPVDVFNTEEGLILAGGYHRLEAHRQDGRETITATIHQGTAIEAKIFACKANAQHGLNMTASERKRSRRDFIKFNLEREPLMSNYDIARSYGGCNTRTIQRDRKALEADGEIEATTQRKGADGKTYDVNNIGGTARTNDLAEAIDEAEVSDIPHAEWAWEICWKRSSFDTRDQWICWIVENYPDVTDKDLAFYQAWFDVYIGAMCWPDYRTGERREKGNYHQDKPCPRCYDDSLPIGYPGAISRRDNKTEICSECGNVEALEDLYHGVYRDTDYWSSHYDWLEEIISDSKGVVQDGETGANQDGQSNEPGQLVMGV